MSFKALIDAWQQAPVVEKTDHEFSIALPIEAAASLHALAELCPGVSLEEITTDLLTTALSELEVAMPYVAGDRVISEDEFGDPVYEDAGPTPAFASLKRKHQKVLRGERS